MVLDQNLRYYGFGLMVGVSNLAHNGFVLGPKKTVGKIFQPVSSYGKFPEYCFIGERVERHLTSSPGTRAKVLDVGSPKLLGLYLASRYAVDLQLTDISHLNVDEYRLLWNSVKHRALGTACFSLLDARVLPYAAATFDVVYSISVVEHVEGEHGDSRSVSEMIRVLKPGGLLLLTVPCGIDYVEQQRVGFRGAVEKTEDGRRYFFQRIYNQAACEARLLTDSKQLENVSLITAYRRFPFLAHLWGCLGQDLRGILGFLNPWLSAVVNRSCEGFCDKAGARYGPLFQEGDVVGNLMIAATKRCHRGAHSG